MPKTYPAVLELEPHARCSGRASVKSAVLLRPRCRCIRNGVAIAADVEPPGAARGLLREICVQRWNKVRGGASVSRAQSQPLLGRRKKLTGLELCPVCAQRVCQGAVQGSEEAQPDAADIHPAVRRCRAARRGALRYVCFFFWWDLGLGCLRCFDVRLCLSCF